MPDIRETAAQVAQAVEQDEIVAMAKDLVRIPSITGYETAVGRFLEDWFKERGYEVDMQECQRGRFQAIARLRGSGGGESLMLNGHIDTNPGTYGYDRPLFDPELEDGVLHGLGLGNMKAGVASMIIAAETVRKAGIPLRGDVVICPVLGELQGGVGTKHLLEKGVGADMAIDPEPFGEHNIVTKHGGMIAIAVNTWISETARGLRYEADAFQSMRRVLNALDGIELTHTPSPAAPNNPTLRVGTVVGGRGTDHDPSCAYMPIDYCTAVLDVRTVPGQTPEMVMADIRRAIDALNDETIAYGLEHPPKATLRPFTVDFPAVDGPTDSPIVETVVRNYRRVTGREPDAVGFTEAASTWANDDSHLWEAGIPTVLYGPGTIWSGRRTGGVPVEAMTLVARVIAGSIVEACS